MRQTWKIGNVGKYFTETMGKWIKGNLTEHQQQQQKNNQFNIFSVFAKCSKIEPNKYGMELWKNELKHVNRPTNQIKTLNDGGTCPWKTK